MSGSTGSSPTIAIVTGYEAELTQARWWRPVSDHWPSLVAPPLIRILSLDDASGDRALAGFAAVLMLPAPATEPRDIHTIIDGLGESPIPIVVVAEDPKRFARLGAEGIMCFAHDEDPKVIAATLAALVVRQATVRALDEESRLLRRFQGGLRNEMEKLQDELQLAASVQREFLPKHLPPVPNADFHVIFRPCGYVSGDIYDVQRLDEDHVGFFLADAVGHGVPAALMTMVIARSITTKQITGSTYRLLPPGEVLRRLNDEMIERHGHGSRFATAVYGVLNCRTRLITLAGAGHPPPLRIRVSDDPDDSSPIHTTKVETSGGLLGIFPNAEFDETTFTLADDEMLVIYSDGFETAFPVMGTEANHRRVPNHHYVEHFVRLARGWHKDGIGPAIRKLGHEIDRQTGSLHQLDDLTALAIVPTRETALEKLFLGTPAGAGLAADDWEQANRVPHRDHGGGRVY